MASHKKLFRRKKKGQRKFSYMVPYHKFLTTEDNKIFQTANISSFKTDRNFITYLFKTQYPKFTFEKTF